MVAGKTNVILGGIDRIVQSPEKSSVNFLSGNGQIIVKWCLLMNSTLKSGDVQSGDQDSEKLEVTWGMLEETEAV